MKLFIAPKVSIPLPAEEPIERALLIIKKLLREGFEFEEGINAYILNKEGVCVATFVPKHIAQ